MQEITKRRALVSKRQKRTGSSTLYWMLIPAMILTFIFSYLPIFGIVMAFQKFSPIKGFLGSKWVGLQNFKLLFHQDLFIRSIWNTVYLSLGKIILGIIVPVILALLLNELLNLRVKKFLQTVFLAPYFLSWAILAGVLVSLFAVDGPVNNLIVSLGGEAQPFLTSNTWFPGILIVSDTWKNMGMNLVIYLAAITNIDPTLYEAAEVDGASYWQKAIYITFPSIKPMIMLLTILSLGSILNAGFEQIYMMYNPAVYASSDIIDTFVYRAGMVDMQYSLSAAAGLFKSLVSFVFVSLSYWFAYKFTDYKVL